MIKTSRKDLLSALRAVGVTEGDLLMVHSYMPALGLMEDGVSGVIDTLLEALGAEGTLVMPTFTFRFFNNKFNAAVPFDPLATQSETGVITEEFRKRSGVIRSMSPIHSVASCGPLSTKVVGSSVTSSFGSESPWALMLNLGGKNLMLGTNYQNGASFLHYVEEMMGVPYRFWKEFPGQVLVSGKAQPIVYRMYVRCLDFDNDFQRVGTILEDAGVVNTHSLGNGTIKAINIKNACDIVVDLVRGNPVICAVPVTNNQDSRGVR